MSDEHLKILRDQIAQLEQRLGPAALKPYYTAKEAIAYLGLPSLASLRSFVRRGALHPLAKHRKHHFTRAELDRFMLRRRA